MSLPFFNSSIISGSTAHNLGGGGGCLPVGGWVELGRTTLACAGDDITVSCLADKRYYMVLGDTLPSGLNRHTLRLNSDTCSNYAWRYSTDGCTDGTEINNSRMVIQGNNYATNEFSVSYIANRSANEKLVISHDAKPTAAGATSAPGRQETASKWANTSNAVSAVTLHNSESGDFASGSELVVLGWDESDTHTNNFWEELASVDSTGDQTVSFTPKKYLWIQNYREGTSGMDFRVGNGSIDTGSNYADRYSNDGGADTTRTSVSGWLTNWEYDTLPVFQNMFIINNASNEKLMLGHRVWQRTAAATTAPSRGEFVGKWDDTSNQIDRIQVYATSGTIGTNIIKVWGAD